MMRSHGIVKQINEQNVYINDHLHAEDQTMAWSIEDNTSRPK